KSLQLLIQVGQQMKFTLNDLVDVSRLQEKDVQLHRAPVNLHNVASGVLDMIRFTTEKKNLDLKLSIPTNFRAVHADKNRLIQVLFNLLHNAVKFTNEGTIVVDAKKRRGIATVTITDTGIGMERETLKSIFEPYMQERPGADQTEGGFGLGLYISKQLVELHGGNIFIESEVGKGTTVTFTLPLADKESIPASEGEEIAATTRVEAVTSLDKSPMSTSSTTKNAKVLIVEDDPINLNVLENMLADEYDISTAANGAKALQLLEIGEWDLVIADVMMPRMSG